MKFDFFIQTFNNADRIRVKRAIFILFIFIYLNAAIAVAAQVVIVGGGISGLTALHELKKAGIDAELYESQSELGGRIKIANDMHNTGLYANVGAELISATDARMIALAKELGINMQDRTPPKGLEAEGFLYKNKYYPKKELQKTLFDQSENCLRALKRDSDEFYADQAKGIKKFDNLSAEAYLEKNGFNGISKDFILAELVSELGVPANELSATVLFDNFEVEWERKNLRFLPHADEMLKVEGGTYKIIEALENKYKSFIHKNSFLEKVMSSDNANYELVFISDAKNIKTSAEHVVLTLPMQSLEKIDFDVKNFPSEVKEAARKTGYANNSKLSLYFKNKTWLKYNHSGAFMSDLNFQVWDSSFRQISKDKKAGSLTAFIGIHQDLEDSEKISKLFLQELEKVFPGINREYMGYSIYHWKNSYSTAYRVGERLHKVEYPKSVGNLHFAGEAFSVEHAGYMEGSVETAQQAANDIEGKINSNRKACSVNFSTLSNTH